MCLGLDLSAIRSPFFTIANPVAPWPTLINPTRSIFRHYEPGCAFPHTLHAPRDLSRAIASLVATWPPPMAHARKRRAKATKGAAAQAAKASETETPSLGLATTATFINTEMPSPEFPVARATPPSLNSSYRTVSPGQTPP